MFKFFNRKELSQAEIEARRVNRVISISFAALISTLLALFLFKIHNETLACLIISTFALITITRIITDFDEIEIGPIKLKTHKKEKE